MNIISRHLFEKFFVQPLAKNTLQNRFKTGDIIRGKIVQALPRQNMFVLNTKGMNLVANTRVSLFVGDKIFGKVMKNENQIELKLTKVNGQEVHQSLSIAHDGIEFGRIPLPGGIFGKEAFLEIYHDRDSGSEYHGSEEESGCHLILNSDELQNVIVDAKLFEAHLILNAWIEDEGLYRFVKSKSVEIEENLLADNIKKVNFQVMPLMLDVSFFRKKWTGTVNLDVRA